MDRTWKHVCLVLWIYFLYLYGIYLFASGFLLNRVVIERKSNREDLVRFFNKTSEIVHRHCDVRSDSILYKLPLISRVCREPFRNEFGNEIRREDPCVFEKRFSRAVMIILDGLRYDFTIYQENGTVSGLDRGNRHLFENKLSVFQELKQKHPTGSVLYPFIADPPTTTLQRLKGLMTGSLPTFIDVSANFASYEISEDNLIGQMHSNGKKIVFMGDDTWKGLFPKKFHRSYFYPSFNVKDLHTVDDGIIKHLIPEMERKDWDIIIAHFLGIDHCGHRFGPSHPEMTRKLAQINSIISSVASLINNDMVLFVFGDHGMTSSGDHGGDSRDELTSALFVYTPSKLFDEHPAVSCESSEYLELVHQVDLVPTISFFLGLPIPFSSLGSVIPSLFYVSTSSGVQDREFKELMSLSVATEILMINTIQVQQYLEVYFTNPDRETQSEFIEAENLLIEVNKTWSDFCAFSDFRKLNEARNKLETIHNGYYQYLKTIKKICDRKWATFDLFLMTNGLIVLTVTTVFCFVFTFLSENVESDVSHLLQFAGVSLTLAVCLYLMDISFLSKMFNTGNITLYITVFLVLLPSLFYCMKFVCYQKNFVFNQFSISLLIFLYFVSFFSNSYVVHEDKCCQYLLQACLIITRLFNKPRTCEKYKPSLDLVFLLTEALELLFLMGSVRCGSLFWKCREEQFLCISSLLPSQLSSFPADYKTVHLFPTCVSLVFTVGFFYWLLYRCLYFSKETASGLCLLYAVPSMTVAIVMYWITEAVPSVVAERVFKGKQEILPQIVYMLASLSLGVVWISPLPVSNMKSTPENMAKLRTVYSSSLLMFCLIILVVSFLLTGDEFSSSLCFLVVSAALYVKRSPGFTMNNEGNLNKFHLPSSVILTWVLFSCHGFFVTGHQCTFPSIHWQAAFVGNSGEFSTNLIPGFLVAFNTFSSYLMFGLSLPLLVTWKHTVFKSQSTDHGELTLFKAPAEFRRGLLRLFVQYILFHGLKLLASSAACALHRRHLMVWKIFAPRLIFEAVAMGITMFGTALGYLFTLRVHFAVQRWLEHISHNKSLEFGAVEYGKLSMKS
ncbi:phosphatidylinositol glycan anchor biosynthesis class O isoform X2 [Tachypleus tridentatus]|uniref:phosphatidylinositol glycan anchor biosynthesis class O isoform X2 n=1 Tax=Tachypleus tridentatus TaxID=6853 RepID=UPI003FD0892C